jgi:hypothetical protein
MSEAFLVPFNAHEFKVFARVVGAKSLIVVIANPLRRWFCYHFKSVSSNRSHQLPNFPKNLHFVAPNSVQGRITLRPSGQRTVAAQLNC